MSETDANSPQTTTSAAKLSEEIANIKAELAIAEAEANAAEDLPPRQRAFVQEYLLDFNATQAAIRAGYSPRTAGQIAGEYFKKPEIQAAVARGQAELLSRNKLKQDVIIREVATLALSNLNHYEITDEGEVSLAVGAPPNAMAAVCAIDKTTTEKVDPRTQEITRTYNVKLKLWPKGDALKLLGKHAGIQSFVDRLEITGKDGGPIEIAAARLTELPLEDLKRKFLELSEQAPVEGEVVAVLEKAS